MIRDELTFSRLFHTEDEDREEDVLHADVIWSSQSLLTDEQGQVHQGLLQLSSGQCFQLFVEGTSRFESWPWAGWSTESGESGGHKVEERFQEGADVLVLERLPRRWCARESCKVALDETHHTLLVM